jgi:ribosome-associated translation inhibitor RaiA
MEARLAGHDPLAIHEDSDQMYQAIHLAAKKLERAVRNKLERHRERLSTD